MIILNEAKYAEECLENGTIDKKPFNTLSILAKYYYHKHGYRKKKIVELLSGFMSKYYPNYNVDKHSWNETIKRIAANAGKFKLYEIDGISITEAQMETIQSIKNAQLERLAFTLLCLAKWGNLRNENNNGWVSRDAKEIFTLARVGGSSESRDYRINDLMRMGLVELPKKNTNMSIRVTYINDKSEELLLISDFRELGYEYLNYKGAHLIRCVECGILMRDNKYHNKKYCKKCNAYQPIKFRRIECVDCGKIFESFPSSRRIRCDECQKEERKRINRENIKRWREGSSHTKI